MEQLSDTIILSPDVRTTNFLAVSFGSGDTCVPVTMGRGFEKKVRSALEKANSPVLVIVPAEQLDPVVIDLCRNCTERQGLTLVWARETSERNDVWLLLKLLENNGATICDTLDTLALTAHLFRQTERLHLRFTTIAPVVPSAAILKHLAAAVAQVVSSDAPKDAPKLKIDRSARISMEMGHTTFPIDASPSVLGCALTRLCGHYQKVSATLPPLEIRPDTDIIELIARPPARILSETTSKRLLSAFGLTPPEELLCDSPSKAVRFARGLNGPATLKLVRPNFRFKAVAGGVIQNVIGPSDIQKAYQSLLSLSEELGGPRALGILVCEQIETEQLFWMDAKRHDQLGRIVYFGRRSEATEQPDGALPLPFTLQQCHGAISRSYSTLSERVICDFAAAMYRFGHMCTQLGEQIGLAQIHPLAITQKGALMLDAVIGITDFSLG